MLGNYSEKIESHQSPKTLDESQVGLMAIIGGQHQSSSLVGNRVRVNSSQFQEIQTSDPELEIEIIQKSGNRMVGYLVQSKHSIKILKFSENSIKKQTSKTNKITFDSFDKKLNDLCAQLVMTKIDNPRFKSSRSGMNLQRSDNQAPKTIVDHYLEYLIARVKIELLKSKKVNCLEQMLQLEAKNPSDVEAIIGRLPT